MLLPCEDVSVAIDQRSRGRAHEHWFATEKIKIRFRSSCSYDGGDPLMCLPRDSLKARQKSRLDYECLTPSNQRGEVELREAGSSPKSRLAVQRRELIISTKPFLPACRL